MVARKGSCTIWAIGYATKSGMLIRSNEGKKIKIPSKPAGNMHAPDSTAFTRDFLSQVGPDDTVISPAGPNYTYLIGAYAKTQKVFWIDPGRLAKEMGVDTGNEKTDHGTKKRIPAVSPALLQLFKDKPQCFYEYKPTDAKVAALRIATLNWLHIERQATADGNSYSQLLRRERDFLSFQTPDKEEWVATFVKRESARLTSHNKKAGVNLEPHQKKSSKKHLNARGEKLFYGYFGDDGVEIKKAQDELVRDRLAWFGAEELEDDAAKKVRALLPEIEANLVFDGVVGEEAIKTRAQVLSYIRNPLFYENFRQLAGYAGVGSLHEGQAVRRRRGERQRGVPEFKRALVFDFAEKYWQCDRIGVVKALYYAYKEHQYLVYWELIKLTQDVWKLMGKKQDEEETDDEVAVEDEEDQGKPEPASPEKIRDIAVRLSKLEHLPMIGRSPKAKAEIQALIKTPDAARLWRLFSRADFGPLGSGLNLQMTPARIERQIKRILGITLLQIVYYRWLEQLEAPLPLAQDFIYVQQWKFVSGKTEGVPTKYDYNVVMRYFQKTSEKLRLTVKLPPEVDEKLKPKEERTPTAPQAATDEESADAEELAAVQAGVDLNADDEPMIPSDVSDPGE